MKLFLDTANLADIKKYAAWGLVDGVTTNPSLVAKEGVSFEKRVKEITKVVKGPVSAEVISTEWKNMVKEGKKYATWAKNAYVKCPMTPDGLIATQKLSKAGIRVNMTLVFSAAQALLAAKAGAAFVSPFIGTHRRHGPRRHAADRRDHRHVRHVSIQNRNPWSPASARRAKSPKPPCWVPTSAPCPPQFTTNSSNTHSPIKA